MKNNQYQSGESTRIITVTAENGDIRNYTIHITRQVINNSYLASLVVDGYELDKIFKKDEYHYVINVPYNKKSLLASEVTAIPEDEKATVQKTSGLVLSGNPGKNIFTILVTARDGFTTSQYTIEVIREGKIELSRKYSDRKHLR
ncbi:MAG: cadherin-like beta sandwich domain-containing protein [Clostridia bacterium]|nr:cadherin-like beta sandwich domain-containing protein [Clostridia bacterium]